MDRSPPDRQPSASGDEVARAGELQRQRVEAERRAAEVRTILQDAADGRSRATAWVSAPLLVPFLYNGHRLFEGQSEVLAQSGSGLEVQLTTHSDPRQWLMTLGSCQAEMAILDVDLQFESDDGVVTARDVIGELYGRAFPARIILLRSSRTVASWALAKELQDRFAPLIAGVVPSIDSVGKLFYELQQSAWLKEPLGRGRLQASPHDVLRLNRWARLVFAAVAAGWSNASEVAAATGYSLHTVHNQLSEAVWPAVQDLIGTESAYGDRVRFPVIVRLAVDLDPWLWPWLRSLPPTADDAVLRSLEPRR